MDELRSDLAEAWRDKDPFSVAKSIRGEVFREREGRRTLRFEINKKSYFLKYHSGIGWPEIIKNLTQVKLPVLTAIAEVEAVRALQRVGIDTLSIAGYGKRGINPAKLESFIVTDDLSGTISLEDLAINWNDIAPSFGFKKSLIKRVADISGIMHSAGVNHRDFYLCHFLINADDAERECAGGPLYLIDLHRAQIRGKVPRRWLIKDLAGLYFSAADVGLSRSDIFRFIGAYSEFFPSKTIRRNSDFWMAVRKEAERLYLRHYGIQPTWPLQQPPEPGDDA
ncbi:MAG: lipopolysaccharide core heptose(I) kinase RfaP [Alcanivorax sp.]|nr:lipopolysaccharide core heptose(I) kinase RfaP [Alcanivorax sp.]